MESETREEGSSPIIDVKDSSPCDTPDIVDVVVEKPTTSDDNNQLLEQQQSVASSSNSQLYSTQDPFISSLSSWKWINIDGVTLPIINRNDQQQYLAVHMVQLRLLSKFPSEIPHDLIQKYTMKSYKMTLSEAWKLNSINTIIRKFDLGCQLFDENDELVKLSDVLIFYWNVKLAIMKRIRKQYEIIIQNNETNIAIVSILSTLIKSIDDDIYHIPNKINEIASEHFSNLKLENDGLTKTKNGENSHEVSSNPGLSDPDPLISSLSSWEWVHFDGSRLPAVTRQGERYVAVQMVQIKLLSKFPSDVPHEIIQKYTMKSHKMTIIEAWQFNSINVLLRKFDLGSHIYSSTDDLVKLNDVQRFYWNVRLINLMRIRTQYEKLMKNEEYRINIPLLATIYNLKNYVGNDIESVKAGLVELDQKYPKIEDTQSLLQTIATSKISLW